jgi:hypothetical protein
VQGKALVQAPVFETKVVFAGVASVTVTPAASDGPLFVTIIEYVSVDPGVAEAGPLLVIVRSALPVTGVVNVELLFAEEGSPVADEAVAVLVIVDPAAPALTV